MARPAGHDLPPGTGTATAGGDDADLPAQRAAARSRWARLLARVYEVPPDLPRLRRHAHPRLHHRRLRPEPGTLFYEAWANQDPGFEHGQVYGFARAVVASVKTLRDAVAFIQNEG